MKQIHDRIANLDRMIERERRPSYQLYYINVLRELEASMRSRLDHHQ